MNPFEAAAAEQPLHFNGGGLLQQWQRARNGSNRQLASSSGELDDIGHPTGGGRGHLSPSVSAMATVSIRSNSGPPAPAGTWSLGGRGGSFLVPGARIHTGVARRAGHAPVSQCFVAASSMIWGCGTAECSKGMAAQM